jgi:hypothetical protein
LSLHECGRAKRATQACCCCSSQGGSGNTGGYAGCCSCCRVQQLLKLTQPHAAEGHLLLQVWRVHVLLLVDRQLLLLLLLLLFEPAGPCLQHSRHGVLARGVLPCTVPATGTHHTCLLLLLLLLLHTGQALCTRSCVAQGVGY